METPIQTYVSVFPFMPFGHDLVGRQDDLRLSQSHYMVCINFPSQFIHINFGAI